MSTLYIMIPAALALAGVALAAFIWAVQSGQYDDPQSDAHRLLFDDDESAEDNS